MKKIGLEVDVPVLDEEKELCGNIEILRDFLRKNMKRYDFKIVIVDNGSVDSTPKIAKELQRRFSDVGYLRLEKRGRGRALRKAWTESNADICCYMDIDLSTDLGALPKLVDLVAFDGYDIATGSRLMEGSTIKRSLVREITSRAYILMLKYFLGVPFNDAQCGFKALNRRVRTEVLPYVLDQEWFFDSELLLKCQRGGYRIKEIPITWIESPDSRVHLMKTAKNYILSLIRLKLEFSIDSIDLNNKSTSN